MDEENINSEGTSDFEYSDLESSGSSDEVDDPSSSHLRRNRWSRPIKKELNAAGTSTFVRPSVI